MKRVLLLFGGNSSEHLVSCRSAKCILENIDTSKYRIDSVGISKENEWFLFSDDLQYLEDGTWLRVSKNRPILNPVFFIHQYDVIFPIIHGTNGEDGKLQGFLDLFHIPYVGCQTLSSALGMDKAIAKQIFTYHKIPQVPYISVNKDYDILKIEEQIDYPMIVKPSNGGSSIGISKVESRKDLKKALKLAFHYDQEAIVESFMHVRELECAILEENGEIKASTVGEVLSANEFYDYEAKYENKESQTVIPTSLPNEVIEQIREYAKSAFQAIHGSGLARVDFFYDEKNKQIYLNEINTLPGFNTISMYPKLWMHEGICYSELLTILIENV